MVVIVDYGMGNLGSVRNMLCRIGVQTVVASTPTDIEQATRLVLPGVGAFDHGMRRLMELGLVPVLNRKVVEEHVPVLGICLGMQLMTERSEEGRLRGLGWIEGESVRFFFEHNAAKLRLPHMGWNVIERRKASTLLDPPELNERYYFVHSFHVRCARDADVLAITHYGIPFTAAFMHGNIMGTQFHPEKSHRFGMRVLRNFVEKDHAAT